MSPHDGGCPHVLEAELTQVDLGQPGVFIGVRGRVPGLHLILTHFHFLHTILLTITKLVVTCQLMLLNKIPYITSTAQICNN